MGIVKIVTVEENMEGRAEESIMIIRNFCRNKFFIVLLCFCFFLSGCLANTAGNDFHDLKEIQIKLQQKQKSGREREAYFFSDDFSYIGSYELVKQYESGGGWYSEEEDIYKYSWSQCLNVWNSYISLYETSHDIVWLDKLSEQIDDVLGRRDCITGNNDGNGFSLSSWSYTADKGKYESYHNPVMIGLIVYPIARFVEEVELNNIKQFEHKADLYL